MPQVLKERFSKAFLQFILLKKEDFIFINSITNAPLEAQTLKLGYFMLFYQ